MSDTTGFPRGPAATPTLITPGDRHAAIERLAKTCDSELYGDVTGYLARWAHPSLSPDRRVALFELYCGSRTRETALREGVADWETELPGLNPEACGDCQIAAADVFGDRACKALSVLVMGGGTREDAPLTGANA